MVEIISVKFHDLSSRLKKPLLTAVILLLSPVFLCQDLPKQKPGKKMIEILHADDGYDEIEEETGKRLTRLLGNVSMKQGEIFMKCDSAWFYPGINQVKAYSKIHMQQGDTLHLYGDSLFYEGSSEMASVDGNVELIDKETHLFTQSIKYDVRNEIATYNTGGKITNGQNTLTSIVGIYYVSQNLFHFKDSVNIVNPDYVMTADTMDYNTKTETAIFTGPSEMNGDSIYLYCEKGWYDTKNDISRIWKNAVIDNKQQVITGDSLYFDGVKGYGLAYRNTSITDTSNNLIVKGNYAWYYKKPERFMVTDNAQFIQVSNKDSLFLHADTISGVTISDSSMKEYRLMRAFYGCRIFSNDLQGKCDSLSYSFRDSVIRMYNAPVIWSEENQLVSDSIALFTKNRQAYRMELFSSAFITSQVDDQRFNQVKGRSLTGFFKDNELYKINVEGNGETVYYLLDSDEVVGVNQAKCSHIEIFVENGKITEIIEHQNPEGIIDPPSSVNPEMLKLDGFLWLDSVRPKKTEDIFRR
jgi:lipopolysaccharide export system protein LptA